MKVGGDEHGAHGDGVDGLFLRHHTRIIHGGEPGRDIAGGYGGVEWNGKEMKTVIGRDVAKNRSWFAGDEGHRGNLAAAQLVERHLLVLVCRDYRYLQQIEKPCRRNSRARTAQIDVDLLIG